MSCLLSYSFLCILFSLHIQVDLHDEVVELFPVLIVALELVFHLLEPFIDKRFSHGQVDQKKSLVK